MAQYEIRDFKVNALPLPTGVPNSRYYIPNGNGTDVDEFITDKTGNYHKVNPISSTGAVKKNFITGIVINGGKAVIMEIDGKIYPFDITNETHYDKYIGIAESSAIENDVCTVVLNGEIKTIGTGWLAGIPYYIASTSFLSSTPPSTGIIKQIGVGISTDTILITNGTELIGI